MVLTTCRVNMSELKQIFQTISSFFTMLVLYIKGKTMITKPKYTSETYLTVAETAELLNVTKSTIYHWILYQSFPELKYFKMKGRIYFKLSSITSLMQ